MRRGFTVLELLVCLAILGLLSALIAPAILASRATADRLTCSTHLAQLALATESYTQQWGGVPQLTPLFKLLPFVEQQGAYALLSEFNPDPPHDVKIPMYYCPSDRWVGSFPRQRRYITSYALNEGTNFEQTNGMSTRGYVPNGVIPWKSVIDGMSHTALYSELLTQGIPTDGEAPSAWISRFGVQEPIRAYWWTARQDWSPGQEKEFASHCIDAANRMTLSPPLSRLTSYSASASNGYQHITPPNSIGCLTQAFIAIAASSRHTGGVNAVFCDGSVHFVNSGIDADLWRSLGTKAGTEPTEWP